MASVCRSAIIAGARSVTTRSRTIVSTLASKPLRSSPIPSSTRVLPCAASRIASVLGGAESMMPLHSAIASARLRSSIAVDSACWGWLSQDVYWDIIWIVALALSIEYRCVFQINPSADGRDDDRRSAMASLGLWPAKVLTIE